MGVALVAPQTEAKLVKEVEPLRFFLGSWHGEGKFANGKPIQAGVTFKADLDGQWVAYRHDDVAPNVYHASTMWGFDPDTKALRAVTFDNFGGQWSFASPGWVDGSMTWTNETKKNGQTSLSHFIFRRVDENSFQMSYEVQVKDKWLPVDSLVFKRIV